MQEKIKRAFLIHTPAKLWHSHIDTSAKPPVLECMDVVISPEEIVNWFVWGRDEFSRSVQAMSWIYTASMLR